MEIKNIILDLGGVIINLSYENTVNAFNSLGLQRFDELFTQKQQEHFFDDFEKGLLSEEEFRKELKRHLPFDITDKAIDEAWNSILLDIPYERLEFLRQLKSTHRLFLLSNTNHIHVKAFSAILEKEYGLNNFENIFDKIYYSCQVNMRKPDPEIFEKVISDNQLDIKETIFIDDSIQHVEGGRKVGLSSYLLEKNVTVDFFLKNLLSINK